MSRGRIRSRKGGRCVLHTRSAFAVMFTFLSLCALHIIYDAKKKQRARPNALVEYRSLAAAVLAI